MKKYVYNGTSYVPEIPEGELALWKAQNVLGAKNLLKFPYAHISKTVNGVIFDVGDDGSITVNGIPTGYASLDLENKSSNFKLAAGDYIFSCSGVFTGNNQYCGVWYKADEATAGVVLGICNVTRQTVPITITEEMENNVVNGSSFFLIRLVIESGAVDNVVYRPMIRLVDDPDDTWAPYAPSNKGLYDNVEIVDISDSFYSELAEGVSIANAAVYKQGKHVFGNFEITGLPSGTTSITMVVAFPPPKECVGYYCNNTSAIAAMKINAITGNVWMAASTGTSGRVHLDYVCK